MNNFANQRLTIARVDPLTDSAALELAGRGWSEPERPAYRQAIHDLATQGQAERVVLLAARQNEALVAAQVAQSLPGRAAVVWPPQFVGDMDPHRDSIARQLVERSIPDLLATGAQIAQALVATHDENAGRLLSLGGFTSAAELLYLAVEVNPTFLRPTELPFQLEPFAQEAESRLIRLIERTYVGTLDCPGIDGLRNTADVVAGYKSVGRFQPELWQIARHEGRDVGCLLVNLHPDVKHAEIVYVALAPEVRGRNWGLMLIKHAQYLAAQNGCERVVLAVDAANQPALRLYSAANFFQFDRRAVWIKSLGPNATP